MGTGRLGTHRPVSSIHSAHEGTPAAAAMQIWNLVDLELIYQGNAIVTLANTFILTTVT